MSVERAQVQEAIVAIVAEQLSKKKEEIDSAATLDSLGMDSLDRVEVVMRIEEEFGVEMSDEKVDTICTLAELIDYVTTLKK